MITSTPTTIDTRIYEKTVWKHPESRLLGGSLDLTDGRDASGTSEPVTMLPSNFTRMLFACLPAGLLASRVVEIGTGGGGLLIAARKFLDATLCVGTDCSADAIDVARLNAERNGVKIDLRCGHMFGPIRDSETFNLIVSNPSSMPDALLAPEHAGVHRSGGPDGRDMVRALATDSIWRLAEAGRLVFVVAGICDIEQTLVEMHRAGLGDIRILHAEAFAVDQRFTPDIKARRQWQRDTGLTSELFFTEGPASAWYEMRYVVSGTAGAWGCGDYLGDLRRARAAALRRAQIRPAMAPTSFHNPARIRSCSSGPA